MIHLGDPNTVSLSNGLVGYWPLDGQVTDWATGITRDLSGNGYNGSLATMSTSSSQIPGKIGQAFNFNGSSISYVSANLSSLGTLSRGTLSAWIKKGRNGTYEIPMEGVESSPSFEGSDPLQFYVIGDCLTNTTSMTINTWYHVVGTWGGVNARVYVNGVLVNTTSCTSAPTMGTFVIGSRIGGFPFLGTIDDVRIYNRALSATEINQLYNAGR